MANFSTNQVRQLYVVKEVKDDGLTATDNPGSIAVKSIGDTIKSLYFEYMGSGGLIRSDLIDVKSIVYAKATNATSLAHKLLRNKVTLDNNVNSGNPVSGQDYILKVVINNYIGLSDEYQYIKYGLVHAVTGMTKSNFYKTLALSLVKNFSTDVVPLIKVYLETGGTSANNVGTVAEVTRQTNESSLTGTYTGIVLEEVPQPWILGKFQQEPVNFHIETDTINVEGERLLWGTIAKVESVNSIKDGHNMADLEFFCMGERGDIYRSIGYPHNIITKYLVDPEKEYNTIDIHYSYQGSGEDIQKSEKDVTIVVLKEGTSTTANDLTNSIIQKINDITSLDLATLTDPSVSPEP